jgi:hypothetical protein
MYPCDEEELAITNERKSLNKLLGAVCRCRLNLGYAFISSGKAKTSKFDILCNQLVDSLIVGAITGVSTYISGGEHASMASAFLGFALTFLIKMKQYRRIS